MPKTRLFHVGDVIEEANVEIVSIVGKMLRDQKYFIRYLCCNTVSATPMCRNALLHRIAVATQVCKACSRLKKTKEELIPLYEKFDFARIQQRCPCWPAPNPYQSHYWGETLQKGEENN